MTREPLGSALSIDRIRDGGCYEFAAGFAREQTNLFFNVGRVDRVFIKTPTERGFHDYRAFVRDEILTDTAIRPVEAIERIQNLPAALERFPQFAPTAERDPETAHYLVVHKLQHERLRAADLIGLPDARFATVANVPAIFQERIPGANLWDMFDFESVTVRKAWQPFKPTIGAQLAVLLGSPLVDHVDWNIRNFIFNGAEQRLYYVDSKPTTFVAQASNDLNVNGIRTHWLS